MTRDGRCSTCGLLVALHFTSDNRKLTCGEVADLGFGPRTAGIFGQQLRTILDVARTPSGLRHAQCGTEMVRKQGESGHYTCPTCCVTVIVGRLEIDHPEEAIRRARRLPTLSEYDGDTQ